MAFFDPFTAMGGAGMMERWVAQDPPLAFKDHTHLTSRGYEMEADLLVDAILAEYKAWREKQKDDPPHPSR